MELEESVKQLAMERRHLTEALDIRRSIIETFLRESEFDEIQLEGREEVLFLEEKELPGSLSRKKLCEAARTFFLNGEDLLVTREAAVDLDDATAETLDTAEEFVNYVENLVGERSSRKVVRNPKDEKRRHRKSPETTVYSTGK